MFSTRRRKTSKRNIDDDWENEQASFAKEVVRTTAGAVTCAFLAIYALNVAQTFPEFRKLSWVDEALRRAPEALFAKPADQERFVQRFFAAHRATFKFIKAPFISAIKQLLPKSIPGKPVTMTRLQSIADLIGFVMPHVKIYDAVSDVIVEGTMAWSVLAISRSYAFWEWVPEWVGVAMQLILALNTAQVLLY